jgi:hypothetical protein
MDRVNINVYKVLVGKSEGKNHKKDIVLDGWIILNYVLNNMDGRE